ASSPPDCPSESTDRRLLIAPPRAIGPIPATSDVPVDIDPIRQGSPQHAEPSCRRYVFLDEHARLAFHDAERCGQRPEGEQREPPVRDSAEAVSAENGLSAELPRLVLNFGSIVTTELAVGNCP